MEVNYEASFDSFASEIIERLANGFFRAIFGGLFYLQELSTCPAPLDTWYVVEWVSIFILLLLFFSGAFRYQLGEKIGLGLIVAFAVWTFAGVGMMIYTFYEDYSCIPYDITDDLAIFCFVMTILFLLILYTIFSSRGISVFNRSFHREGESTSIIDKIKRGEIDRTNVERVIASMRNVDGYALFPAELKTLHKECSLPSVSPEEECSICMGNLADSIAIAFPICRHKYHTQCLDRWLQTKTTCPLCRGGVRSSLIRFLVQKYSQRQ